MTVKKILFSTIVTTLFIATLTSCISEKKRIKIEFWKNCDNTLFKEIHYNEAGKPILEIGHESKFKLTWEYDHDKLIKKTEHWPDQNSFDVTIYHYDKWGNLDYGLITDTISKIQERVLYSYKNDKLISEIFYSDSLEEMGTMYNYDSSGKKISEINFFYGKNGNDRVKVYDIYHYNYYNTDHIISEVLYRGFAKDTIKSIFIRNEFGYPIKKLTHYCRFGEYNCFLKYDYEYY